MQQQKHLQGWCECLQHTCIHLEEFITHVVIMVCTPDANLWRWVCNVKRLLGDGKQGILHQRISCFVRVGRSRRNTQVFQTETSVVASIAPHWGLLLLISTSQCSEGSCMTCCAWMCPGWALHELLLRTGWIVGDCPLPETANTVKDSITNNTTDCVERLRLVL